MYFRGLRH